MKNYILLTLIFLGLISCSKNNTSLPDEITGQRYPVKFTVTSFSQTHDTIANGVVNKKTLADVPLNTLINGLTYRVYDANGVMIKVKSQVNTQSTFGEITDSLAVGNYSIVFVGLKEYNAYNGFTTSADSLKLSPTGTGPTTVYHKKIELSVTPSGNNGGTVTLDRVSAGLQVVLKDIGNTLPDGSASFRAIQIIYHDYASFSIKDGNIGPGNNWLVTTDETQLFNTPFKTPVYANILNTSTPMSITIKAIGYGTSPAITKTIPNVRFFKNTKTTLTGSMFTDDPPGIGFKSIYYPYFEADSIIKNF